MLQATVVTADGSILTANETSNPDLFWAIRGSGSNFGVCTEFVLKLHPQRPKIFGGPLIFSIPRPKHPESSLEYAEGLKKSSDLLNNIVTATQRWWSSGPSEKEGMLQVCQRGPGGEVGLHDLSFSHGFDWHGSHVLSPLFSIMGRKKRGEQPSNSYMISVRVGNTLYITDQLMNMFQNPYMISPVTCRTKL
jgi:hypothetical protein